MPWTRRGLLKAGTVGALASTFVLPRTARAGDEALDLVQELIGRAATESGRVHLKLPAEFPTGYTVPMDIDVDSPMSAADHVRYVRVFAPRNPIVEVVRFDFVPERSIARVSTRIRLAEPQFVIAVAEMSDDTMLMAKAWVDVATNGCA